MFFEYNVCTAPNYPTPNSDWKLTYKNTPLFIKDFDYVKNKEKNYNHEDGPKNTAIVFLSMIMVMIMTQTYSVQIN